MLDNFTTRVLDAMDDEHLFINKKNWFSLQNRK